MKIETQTTGLCRFNDELLLELKFITIMHEQPWRSIYRLIDHADYERLVVVPGRLLRNASRRRDLLRANITPNLRVPRQQIETSTDLQSIHTKLCLGAGVSEHWVYRGNGTVVSDY